MERAAAEGKKCEIGEFRQAQVRPQIKTTVKLLLPVWLRATAKMTLGIASHVYPAEWRSSSDAEQLRHLMRSDDPRTESGEQIDGLYPHSLKDDPLGKIAVPPEHVAWFVRGYDEATRLHIVIFGELMVSMKVDTAGMAVPPVAWRLDPRRPNAKGETTWDQLMLDMLWREKAKGEAAA